MILCNVRCLWPFFLFIWSFFLGNPTALASDKFKVLVVMSYEENYPWVKEIRSGIESVLLNKAIIKYFYLNTKTQGELAATKAKEAFALYKEYNPDGVIACDDDAQLFFVVPYLENKEKTPVIFCGVNEDPEKYGYPATNVTGILERELFKESLLFAKGLDPRFKRAAYIGKNDLMSKGIAVIKKLKAQTDLLIYVTLEGVKDKNGLSYNDQKMIWTLVKEYGKPLVSSAAFRVEMGALCAVMKSGEEFGVASGEMLMKAMTGTSVSKIPMTANQFGKRIINADMVLYYELRPRPEAIRGAEIVPLNSKSP